MQYAMLVYIRELEKAFLNYMHKRNESTYQKVTNKYIKKMNECKEEKRLYINKKIIEKSNLTSEEKKMAISYYYEANDWKTAFECSGLLKLIDKNCDDIPAFFA